jgi:hypothetical protein
MTISHAPITRTDSHPSGFAPRAKEAKLAQGGGVQRKLSRAGAGDAVEATRSVPSIASRSPRLRSFPSGWPWSRCRRPMDARALLVPRAVGGRGRSFFSRDSWRLRAHPLFTCLSQWRSFPTLSFSPSYSSTPTWNAVACAFFPLFVACTLWLETCDPLPHGTCHFDRD